ncbi:hypothetical protein ACFLXB_05695 [Chloroflexota bacterium]
MSGKGQINKVSTDLVGKIETRLSGMLKPVKPNPAFVDNLRDRFQAVQHPAIIKRFNNLQFITILVAGILSIIVLVTMGAKFMMKLLLPGKKSTGIS